MEEIDHVDGSVCTFVTTTGLCSLGNQIRTAYAGEIPDFTNTTAEQVDEWIDVCNFCSLAYASKPVLFAVQHATEAQIRDENWLKYYWNLDGVDVGNMIFWYKTWKFLNRPGMTWKKFECPEESGEDSEAYIFCDNETLTIAWAGTDSNEDIVANFQYSFVEWPHNEDVKGRVHVGFLNAFNAIRDPMRQWCEKLMAERSLKQMNITGHSAGGAMTALSCLDFTLNPLKGQPPIHAIAMATPSCATKEFSEYFSTVCPNLDSLSNCMDPLMFSVTDQLEPCGNRQYLKITQDAEFLESHQVETYRRYVEETKRYIQENQVQQQAATNENRFVYS